jgi:cytochrome c biogenesis protein
MKQYKLDTKTGVNGVALSPGDKLTLPAGDGTLTFDGIKTWASFTVSHQSGNTGALVSGAAAILGLMGSLFIQRRRIWVRATPAEGGGSLVELGGLGRSESARIADELGDVAVDLLPAAPVAPDEPAAPDPDEPAEPAASAAAEPEAPAEPAASDDEGARA